MDRSVKSIVIAALFLLLQIPLLKYDFGEKNCFIAMEEGQVIYQKGDCYKRNSPYCTFNVVLSLTGFDTGVLEDEYHPIWPYHEGYLAWFDSWKQDHYPKLWRKNSTVWYSTILAKKLGMDTLEKYVGITHYGNQDISGDPGLNNGLTQSWISSSLEISPYEQVMFLDNMLNQVFPLSDHAYEMTRRIMYNRKMHGDWDLYGKVGSGWQLSPDRKQKIEAQSGWFVGWIEKGDRKIVFAWLKEEGRRIYEESVYTRARKDAIRTLGQILDKEG